MLPVMHQAHQETAETAAEREAIIRSIFQLKQDVEYLKEVVAKAGLTPHASRALSAPEPLREENTVQDMLQVEEDPEEQEYDVVRDDVKEEMSIRAANMELIEKVLAKHGGNRKAAAAELGISERTLYRKLKQK